MKKEADIKSDTGFNKIKVVELKFFSKDGRVFIESIEGEWVEIEAHFVSQES